MGELYAQITGRYAWDLEKAGQAMEQKEYEQAANMAGQIIAQDSLALPAYQILAASNLAMMQFTEAENAADNGLKHFPSSEELIWLKAESQLQRGKLNEALSGYRDLLGQTDRISQEEVRLRLGITHQVLGGRYYMQDNFDLAETHLQSAKTYLPDSVSSYSNLALVYAKQEKWFDALEVVKEGRAVFPENEDLMKLGVSLLYENKDYDAILREYAEIYDRNPSNIDNALAYGELLLAQGLTDESEKVFEELIEKYPKEKKIYLSLAGFFETRRNFEAQRGALRKLQQQYPDDYENMQRIAQSFIAEEDWENARAAYDSALVMGGSEDELVVLKADTYLKENRFDEAQQIYEDLLRRFPDKTELLWLKAENEEKMNNYPQALQTYQQIKDLDDTIEAIEKLGLIYYKTNDVSNTIVYLEDAAVRYSENPMVYYVLAQIYHNQGLIREAFYSGHKSLKTTLVNIEGLQQNLASVLRSSDNMLSNIAESRTSALGLKEQNEIATEIFGFITTKFDKEWVWPVMEELIDDYPSSGLLFYMVGGYYLDSGRRSNGIALIKESVVLSPNLSNAHTKLGDIYKADGETNNAILAYERAISSDFENKKAYKKLINLHNDNGTLDSLCNRWTAQLRVKPNQPILREFLIEALHKADRFDEAKEFINYAKK